MTKIDFPEKFKISTSRFIAIKALRNGSQGSVCLARRTEFQGKKDDMLVVCKKSTEPLMLRGNPTEMEVLINILPENHRINKCLLGVNMGSISMTIFEYCDQGDLHDVLDRYFLKRKHIPEEFIWHVFIHLSEALAFIHHGYGDKSKRDRWTQVVHRDIKPANVFLIDSGSNYPEIILGDFGLSGVPGDRHHQLFFEGGTYEYQPPERPEATPAGDVWALGAIIHQLCTGQPPIRKQPDHWKGTKNAWLRAPQARQQRPLPLCYSSTLEYWLSETLTLAPQYRATSLRLACAMAPTGRKIRGSRPPRLI